MINQGGLGSAIVNISLASTRFISLSHSVHLKSAGEVGRCCRARVLEYLKPSVKHSRLEMNFCSTHCPELVPLPNLTQGGCGLSYHNRTTCQEELEIITAPLTTQILHFTILAVLHSEMLLSEVIHCGF